MAKKTKPTRTKVTELVEEERELTTAEAQRVKGGSATSSTPTNPGKPNTTGRQDIAMNAIRNMKG